MSTPSTVDWTRRVQNSLDVVYEVAEARQDHLTDPDADSGERWTGRQVVAHMVELLEYWMAEASRVAASEVPVPVGRPKSDLGRVTAVADGQDQPIDVLLGALHDRAAQVLAWLERLEDEDLNRSGEHFKRGPMTVGRVVEHFVVEHLEEHAAQLLGTTDPRVG
jgi:DinB superfamily